MATKHGIINKLQILLSVCSLTITAVATPATIGQRLSTDDYAEKSVKLPDMQMAADDYSPVAIVRSQEHHFVPTPAGVFPTTPLPQISARIDQQFHDSPRFFAPNHEYQEPSAYIRVPNNPGIINNPRNRAQYQRSYDPSVGSGDFGVLRGGTFYPREEAPYHNDEYSDYSDYNGETSSGHGHPAAAEFIQKYTYPEEQFEHFRDFADLSMEGIDGDFSQLSTVYTSASKNSTKSSEKSHPRNIIEQLELIDREKALMEKKSTTSKSKSKLAATKLEKSYRKQSDTKQIENEPLLALNAFAKPLRGKILLLGT